MNSSKPDNKLDLRQWSHGLYENPLALESNPIPGLVGVLVFNHAINVPATSKYCCFILFQFGNAHIHNENLIICVTLQGQLTKAYGHTSEQAKLMEWIICLLKV